MSKGNNNIKRLGVKSIHYHKDKVILEDSFSKDNDVIYDVRYDDIDLLMEAKEINKKKKDHLITLEDALNKSGFTLKGTVNGIDINSKINRVKSVSYLHKKTGLSLDDNFNIQIYNNFADINKIIISYCNHVIYSLNDLSKGEEVVTSKTFDEIGTIPYKLKLHELVENDKKKRIETYFIPKIIKMIDDYKILNLDSIKSYNKDWKQNRQETFVLKENEKKKFAYNYIRTIAAIRNIIVHDENVNISELDDLCKLSKDDIKSYINNLVKNNSKYFYILENTYNDKSVIEEFLNYMIYDTGKNIGFSVEKIAKIVFEKDDSFDKVNEREKEFRNKYKTMLKFDVYKKLKDNSESYIERLKQTDDKEKLYEELAKEYENKVELYKLKSAIRAHLGKDKKYDKLDKNLGIKLKEEVGYIELKFYNLVYLLSKCLTKKEANDMFSRIVTKLDNINDLLILAKKNDVVIDASRLKKYNHLYDLSSKNYPVIKQQLLILKNLCNRRSNDGGASIMEDSIYMAFNDGGLSKENYIEALSEPLNKNSKNKREKKPFKNFLRNNVLKAKQFQYISRYMDPTRCKTIINNDKIVSFVLDDMYGDKQSYDTKKYPLKAYLSKIYFKFLNKDQKKETIIDPVQLEQLKGYLKDVTLKNLLDSINRKTYLDYTSLVNLYLNVCYLVVKHLFTLNSTYFIQIQEYDLHYKLINDTPKQIVYDLTVLKDYMENANKKTRYYKQLESLINKDYMQNMGLNKYRELIREYRNIVEHCTLLTNKDGFDFKVEKLNSYFAIYQIMIQKQLKEHAIKVWQNNYETYFPVDEKGYSTRLAVALNMPFAYSSRFNNITIEKYYIKAKCSSN